MSAIMKYKRKTYFFHDFGEPNQMDKESCNTYWNSLCRLAVISLTTLLEKLSILK